MIKKLTKLWTFLDKNNKNKVILILFLTIFGSIFEMVALASIIPIFKIILFSETPSVINKIFVIENMQLFISIFFVIFFIIKNAILTLFTYLTFKYLSEIRQFFSNRLFLCYINSNYSFFVTNNSSNILKNITSLISNINTYILDPLGIFLTELFVLIALGILCIAYKPVESICLILILFSAGFLYFKKTKLIIRDNGQIGLENDAIRIKVSNEMIGSIKDIKLYNKSNFFIDKYTFSEKKVARSIFIKNFYTNVTKYFLESILILGFGSIIFITSYRGSSIESIIPLLGFYVVAGFRIIPSINKLINASQLLKFGEPMIDEVCKELRSPFCKITNKDNLQSINNIDNGFNEYVKLQDLSFRFNKSKAFVLNKVNLRINKGDTIGIFGESGSGKSTLLSIILGFHQPTSGSIVIDDVIVSKMKNNIFGYVPQDIFLLDDSILSNVAFGLNENEVDIEKVIWALNEAELGSFIQNQRDGIRTIVGERGIKISGGQKQRIGIARMLYQGSKILVFDESTSALDQETERLLMKNIYNLKQKYTIIIVAHRISTLKYCNKVFQLKNKKLIKN